MVYDKDFSSGITVWRDYGLSVQEKSEEGTGEFLDYRVVSGTVVSDCSGSCSFCQGGNEYRGLEYKKNQDLIDEILKTLISKGKGIEINTSGYRYKEDRFYPCTDVVKRYFELGGEIITIGSDSHIKEYITMDFDIVYEFLKSIGVKYICGFDKLNPVFKKLK